MLTYIVSLGRTDFTCSALFSRMPSAKPQICMSSSLVSVSKSAPIHQQFIPGVNTLTVYIGCQHINSVYQVSTHQQCIPGVNTSTAYIKVEN